VDVSFLEKEARVPAAPAPVFANSAKVTLAVLGVAVLHIDQPAGFIWAPRLQEVKATRANCVQGRPRNTWPVKLPAAAVVVIVDWLMTKRLRSVEAVGPSAVI